MRRAAFNDTNFKVKAMYAIEYIPYKCLKPATHTEPLYPASHPPQTSNAVAHPADYRLLTL